MGEGNKEKGELLRRRVNVHASAILSKLCLVPIVVMISDTMLCAIGSVASNEIL